MSAIFSLIRESSLWIINPRILSPGRPAAISSALTEPRNWTWEWMIVYLYRWFLRPDPFPCSWNTPFLICYHLSQTFWLMLVYNDPNWDTECPFDLQHSRPNFRESSCFLQIPIVCVTCPGPHCSNYPVWFDALISVGWYLKWRLINQNLI